MIKEFKVKAFYQLKEIITLSIGLTRGASFIDKSDCGGFNMTKQ